MKFKIFKLDNRTIPLLPTILFLGSIVIIYFNLAKLINKNGFGISSTAYYNNLLSSFFGKKLDISSTSEHDLSFFGAKKYLYWGPSPVLYILPFYLLSRGAPSDVLYTLISACLIVFIIFLAINEVDKYLKLSISLPLKYLVVLFFSFCSPNLYLSLGGRIWHSNQVISIFYLTLFYLLFFYFLNNPKIIWLTISVIFLNLAVLARYTLIFNFLFFFYLFTKPRYLNIKKAIAPIFITVSFFCCFFIYNYLRFGNIFETGYRYQNVVDRFKEPFQKNQIFSSSNIFKNIKYYFGNPPLFLKKSPYIKFDLEGNGIFFMYPFLPTFLTVPFLRKHYSNKSSMFISLSFLVISLNILILLLNLGTGWMQIGSRYFFDVIPLFTILLLFTIPYVPKIILILLLICGGVINILGALAFYGMAG